MKGEGSEGMWGRGPGMRGGRGSYSCNVEEIIILKNKINK